MAACTKAVLLNFYSENEWSNNPIIINRYD